MILGFTGTREGMTNPQREAVAEFLRKHRPSEVHAGDCLGADSEFLDAALIYNGNFPPRTHGHPCDIKKWRAHREYDVLHPVKSAAERNQDIVDVSDELLAAPLAFQRQVRSGTWQTISMAVKAKKQITLAWPDGSITAQGYTSLAGIFGV